MRRFGQPSAARFEFVINLNTALGIEVPPQ